MFLVNTSILLFLEKSNQAKLIMAGGFDNQRIEKYFENCLEKKL